ncbi:hypothetical protein TrCOL_g10764 [Triparma columacea]|uniref:Uncharacterized protein n=1 Tax=Triparma columacea TaxID=722753 RepID=A0A9W7GR03_9STRA|nr:hypothetical protein TrCOL_g10764 [Triparma columacea]
MEMPGRGGALSDKVTLASTSPFWRYATGWMGPILPLKEGCLGRGCGILGMFVGFISIMPAMMMSDPGTKRANRIAFYFGSASLMLFFGGIMALITGRMKWTLGPGTAMYFGGLVFMGMGGY